MSRGWPPHWGWVFGVATLLGLFSSLQAIRLNAIANAADDVYWFELVGLNLVYWYIPAVLAPSIMRLATRYRIERGQWRRALPIHVAAALGLSIVHVLGMVIARALIWPDAGKPGAVAWDAYIQRQYLMNLDWALMTYSTIAGVSHAAAYYREAQAKAVRSAQLETRLVESQLKTLQAQLHPHFLFNTLHALSTLVHRDPEAADRMICRLSDLLRLTLDRKADQLVAVKDEIDFLQKYLDIEKMRFGDRIRVEYMIDPAALDGLVPALALQPLVENAVKHGVTARSQGGLIEISAWKQDERLWLSVRDNGDGLTEGGLAALEKGIGLSNTRARLECLYGRNHRFEFSNAQGGLTVRIVLPWRTETVDGAETQPTAVKWAS
jgi:LytS/YehU family sensor histidine kinase